MSSSHAHAVPTAHGAANAHSERSVAIVAAFLARVALFEHASVLKVLVRVAVLAQLLLLVGRWITSLANAEATHHFVSVNHVRVIVIVAVAVIVRVSVVVRMCVVVTVAVLHEGEFAE